MTIIACRKQLRKLAVILSVTCITSVSLYNAASTFFLPAHISPNVNSKDKAASLKPGNSLAVVPVFNIQRQRERHCWKCFKFPMPPLPRKIMNMCASARELELVIIVESEVGAFEERKALRDTWLMPRGVLASKVRHLFLVGSSRDNLVHKKLHQEMAAAGDILQGNFPDSNQTLKTMMGLIWVVHHCRQALHVLKTKQDVWVNLPSLIVYLRLWKLRPPVGLGGHCSNNNKPDRNPMSKFFMPKKMFSDTIYPSFCRGSGYVTTPDIAERIVRVSENVPFFHLEDVYIGFCLQALHLTVKRLPGFNLGKDESKWISMLCQLKSDNIFLLRGFTPQEIKVIWAERKCPAQSAPHMVGFPVRNHYEAARQIHKENILKMRFGII